MIQKIVIEKEKENMGMVTLILYYYKSYNAIKLKQNTSIQMIYYNNTTNTDQYFIII